MSQYPHSLFAEPRLQPLECDLFAEHNIDIRVLRLDEMHPHLGGNKWFKLRLNIEQLKRENLPLAVSFGGAWSNHLRALAAAGLEYGFTTLGFVRGERSEPLNPVLAFAEQCGMELRYLSRTDYRRKNDAEFLASLCAGLGPHLLIPEGGSNAAGFAGCMDLAQLLRWPADANSSRWVALACGTGTTMAGLIRGLERRSAAGLIASKQQATVLGISVLKATGYIEEQVSNMLASEPSVASELAVTWRVFDDFHCGGYARSSADLESFLAEFTRQHSLPLEPVYTGKLMFGICELIRSGRIPRDSSGVIVHSGGVFAKNGKNSHKSV